MNIDDILFTTSVYRRDPLFKVSQEHNKEKHKSKDQINMTFLSCNICYELQDPIQFSFKCDNQLSSPQFCRSCLTSYLKSQIQDAKFSGSGLIPCPCGRCDFSFARDDILTYIADDQWIQRYDAFLEIKQVDENPLCRWCPAPNCKSIVQMRYEKQCSACCPKCRLKFCTKCGGMHNSFLSCGMFADYRFSQWRISTKDGCRRCPGCQLFIEKNLGCDHMTCSRCRYEFCWNCSSRWRGKCTALKTYCAMSKVLNHRRWGSTITTRCVTKTIAVPVAVVGAGICVGLVSAVGAVCVAGVAVVGSGALVAIPVYAGCRYVRRTRSDSRPTRPDPLRILVHGVRVLCPWRRGDPVYQHAMTCGNRSTFLGMPGREVNGMFIAYFNNIRLSRVADAHRTRRDAASPPHSAVLYFVPFDVPIAAQDNLMPYPMLEVDYPGFMPPQFHENARHITYRHTLISLTHRLRTALTNNSPLVAPRLENQARMMRNRDDNGDRIQTAAHIDASDSSDNDVDGRGDSVREDNDDEEEEEEEGGGHCILTVEEMRHRTYLDPGGEEEGGVARLHGRHRYRYTSRIEGVDGGEYGWESVVEGGEEKEMLQEERGEEVMVNEEGGEEKGEVINEEGGEEVMVNEESGEVQEMADEKEVMNEEDGERGIVSEDEQQV